jgi:TRAP transporter TAXI family solute receptor
MKHASIAATAAAAFAVALGTSTGATGKDFYKLSSLAPGATPYAVNTTFAKVINKYYPNVEVQVNATGAAPAHAMDAANGKVHFFMQAPVLHHLMTKKQAMFAKVDSAPELAQKLRSMFNYSIGMYHFVVYADSGFKSLKDIKGKRVFLGPPTGAARTVAMGLVDGATGLQAGKDYQEARLDFGPARQAFQDRQIDMIVDPTNAPSAFFSQIALTSKIRLLGLTDEDFKQPKVEAAMKLPGRSRGTIPAGVYGPNQVNTESVGTVQAWVGMGTSIHVPEDVVYKMTKIFWEHIDEVHEAATWMKSAVNKDVIFSRMNMKLHPGAARYYKEIGLKIPPEVLP